MAHDLEFTTSAVEDLSRLIKHNPALAVQFITKHLPAVVRGPEAAGEQKKGDLAHVRAYGFSFRGVAYRVAYAVDEARQIVTVIAIGVHDEAYRRARNR